MSVIPTFNPPFPDKFKYLHIPAYDDESQNLEPHFLSAVSFIKEVLTNQGKILIHCMVGRSRSVSMFLAFLIYILKNNFDQSIVDITSNSDASNEIEYSKITRCKLVSTPIDNSDITNEISHIEYIKPQFINKYRTFMIYKKQTMIDEIEKLKITFQNMNRSLNTIETMYNELAIYIKKYRTIAQPNPYFKKQLIQLLG